MANAASRTISSFEVAPDGSLGFLAATPNQGTTALDEALSGDGRHLYVLAGSGIVEFAVAADGSLTRLGSQTDVPTSAAGLAAR